MIRAVAFFALLPLCAEPGVVRVQLTQAQQHRVVSMDLEQYVAAVLAGESSVFQSDEALKAMAVVVRTYATRLQGRHAKDGYDFCSTTHCQRVELGAVTPRLLAAAEATAGELIWYEGKPAFTSYTANCGGRTEEARSVWEGIGAPYLKAREDPYCLRSGGAPWHWTAAPQEIVGALREYGLKSPANLQQIAEEKMTTSGRAKQLRLSGGGEVVSIDASSFRFAMGRVLGWNTIRSNRFDVRFADGRFIFDGKGAGHGVGLCQRGAEQMGIDGHSYREILSFYFPDNLVGLNARGLKWTRLGGEMVAVMTMRPDHDARLVSEADRITRALSNETHLAAPRNIEIRVYPDVETFRNATGEPGWVAANTRGTRIHLQPTAAPSALRHELLHVLVESQAKPGLPIWFREGLVEYLDSPSHPSTDGSIVIEVDMRQRADAPRARAAYAAAKQQVASLVQRYGTGTVSGWLTRGLPPELNLSTSSQAPTKSK